MIVLAREYIIDTKITEFYNKRNKLTYFLREKDI